jgi:hypothetical protein
VRAKERVMGGTDIGRGCFGNQGRRPYAQRQ